MITGLAYPSNSKVARERIYIYSSKPKDDGRKLYPVGSYAPCLQCPSGISASRMLAK